MGIKVKSELNSVTFLISGDIDHHSSSLMRNFIDNFINKNNNITEVFLDFSEVNFMDSSGIGLIMGRYKLTNSLNIKFEIINIPPRIKRIIDFSGIGSLGVIKKENQIDK